VIFNQHWLWFHSHHILADRSTFVTPLGGKNLGIHQTKERPEFLSKMLAAYRSSEVADNTNERKDDETRNFLMRRNNLLLQARRTWRAACDTPHVTRCM
jgi:hypothetical protein